MNLCQSKSCQYLLQLLDFISTDIENTLPFLITIPFSVTIGDVKFSGMILLIFTNTHIFSDFLLYYLNLKQFFELPREWSLFKFYLALDK